MADIIGLENGQYLYLLWLIPLLAAAAAVNGHRQRSASATLGNAKLVNNLIVKAPSYLYVARVLLLLSALTALIFALANPLTEGNSKKPSVKADTEIVFVLDVSKSMLSADVLPNRLAASQNFILKVMNKSNGEQIGISIFAGSANAYSPLTADYAFTSNAIRAISPNLIARQGTSLAEALKISALQYSPANKKLRFMCLLSDGEDHNSGYEKVADSLRRKGIHLFAIGVGTKNGGTIQEADPAGNISVKKGKDGSPVITQLYEQTLLAVTGGARGHYQELSDKNVIAGKLMKQVAKIQEDNRETVKGQKNCFQLCLIIALLLLAIETIISFTQKTNKSAAYGS
jgi:Ca-activated chloride channel family protein